METQDVKYERLKELCTQCGKSYAEGTGFCPIDGAELMRTMADPLVGTVLPRRYRVASLLGRGSMSVVYKGIYEPLDQPVAVKMLKSHLVSDPQQAKRFQQEIKTAGALNHRNIVGILDFGVTDQGVPYLIMDYLDGKSLSELLDADERISVNRTIKIFSQACDALAYAHACGVIHRDIKPSNLVILKTEEETDLVKVVDFGIAKIMSNSDSQPGSCATGNLALTATGEVIGTPLYMSPEQANGRDLDGRSDIYSLGCVIYHAITGRPPFVGDTAIDTIRLQITGAAAPIDKVRPDLYIPERLQSVVTKALQKDPRLRYQSMEHLKADLESCAPRRDSAQSQTLRVPRETEQPAFETVGDTHEGTMRLPVLALCLVALVIVGIAAFTLLSDKKHPPAAAPRPAGTVSDTTWRQDIVAAQAASEAGQYAQALSLYNDAMGETKKFPAPDVRTAVVLNGLAQTYFAQEKLADAEAKCKEALDIYDATSKNDPARADVFTNLARIYTSKGNLASAEACAKRALEIRQKTLGATHHDVALSLQLLATISSARGNYKLADEQLTRALSMAEKSLGNDNPDVAGLLHDLGLVRAREGKTQSAEQLLNRALAVRRKCLGSEHPAVADTLTALGTLDFDIRRDASAEMMFKKALTVREKVFGQRSRQTAEVYSCLARFYDDQKRLDEAQECYSKALSVRESLWGKNDPRLAPTLASLIKFSRAHNQPAAALQYEAQLKRLSR